MELTFASQKLKYYDKCRDKRSLKSIWLWNYVMVKLNVNGDGHRLLCDCLAK